MFDLGPVGVIVQERGVFVGITPDRAIGGHDRNARSGHLLQMFAEIIEAAGGGEGDLFGDEAGLDDKACLVRGDVVPPDSGGEIHFQDDRRQDDDERIEDENAREDVLFFAHRSPSQ